MTEEVAAGVGVKKGCGVVSLQYHRPWAVFVPTVVAFFLLNYLACCTTVNADGTDLVLSPGLAAAASGAENPLFFSAHLFLEENVMRKLFHISRFFGGMDGIRIIWSLAWMAHCLEFGIAVRICVSCRATPLVFALYTVLALIGGAPQLVPLFEARREYLSANGSGTHTRSCSRNKIGKKE